MVSASPSARPRTILEPVADGARPLYERALTIREARLEPDHPDTARSRERLAAVVAALENRQ